MAGILGIHSKFFFHYKDKWSQAKLRGAWEEMCNSGFDLTPPVPLSFHSTTTFPISCSSSRFASSPSPSEVANAIAAAKQASGNVLIAQQQMQAAKENVLNQQRMAMEKEAAAALLTQKSEAAAAIQRSEAAAAAQAVVLAQQRLAATKAAVSQQQRIAAAREAEAAQALQRSAHAAAAEIQKTEYEASKLGQYARNNNAGAAHHLTYTKDAAFGPINAGTNHVPNLESLGPWSAAAAAAAAGAKSGASGGWL